jgi:hypothetical protein
MAAFNAVRFRAKPGREQEFFDAHATRSRGWSGWLLRGSEWQSTWLLTLMQTDFKAVHT